MPSHCVHCHKPADRRCGNVLDLDNGDRLHRGCLHRHLLMVIKAIPEPKQTAAVPLAPPLTFHPKVRIP